MKRITLIMLTLLMAVPFLSFALSESVDACRQDAETIVSDESLEALLSALSDSGAVTHSWEGSDGAAFVLVLYPETAVIDCGGTVHLEESDAALTSEQLLSIMNWVESQVQAQAADGKQNDGCLDPAVYQTAKPAESGMIDPAVYFTARPAETPAPDPAMYQMAQPSAAPAVQPAWSYPARTAAPTAAPTSRPIASTGDYTTFDSSMQEQKLLNLLNEDRARNGLPPLALDPELSRLAQLKASDMNSNHYFAHESPTYGNANQMLDAFNYDYRGMGENIAHHANVEKAEAAFMSSEGHRRNILGSQWEKVGIGVVHDDNGNVYVTQLFAR